MDLAEEPEVASLSLQGGGIAEVASLLAEQTVVAAASPDGPSTMLRTSAPCLVMSAITLRHNTASFARSCSVAVWFNSCDTYQSTSTARSMLPPPVCTEFRCCDSCCNPSSFEALLKCRVNNHLPNPLGLLKGHVHFRMNNILWCTVLIYTCMCMLLLVASLIEGVLVLALQVLCDWCNKQYWHHL